jgi:hypothetical protein
MKGGQLKTAKRKHSGDSGEEFADPKQRRRQELTEEQKSNMLPLGQFHRFTGKKTKPI